VSDDIARKWRFQNYPATTGLTGMARIDNACNSVIAKPGADAIQPQTSNLPLDCRASCGC
jgi:hypothetical protein